MQTRSRCPHKYKSRREQDEKLEFLLSWVREYYVREGDLSLVAHQALFDAYAGPKRKLISRVEQQLIDGSMLLETCRSALPASRL